MNRPILKASVASFIVLVLVYYSAAWAVLGCLHDEDFANTPAAPSAAVSGAAWHQDLANSPQTYFDCMGADYHTEVLAGVSAPVELRLSKSDLVTHSFALAPARSAGESRIGSLWLSALFDDWPVHSSGVGLPLYLSVSVLRI
jgi:hypothetical protein